MTLKKYLLKNKPSMSTKLRTSLASSAVLAALPMGTFAAEFCSDAYYVEQTLSNGAKWDMCWEHRAREGTVLHHVHYTPINGARRKVLHQASVAQIHVPYDDNGARFHDISDYGIGNNYMLNLSSTDCPGGTILQHQNRPLVCKQVLDQSFGYKFGGQSVQSELLSLYSVSAVGAYNYIPSWHFYDNGTIEPGMGATGALQRYGSTSVDEHGWQINSTTVGISHLHNYFWKLDFDLGNNGNDDFAEELNFTLSNGKRQRTHTRFNQETSRSVEPNQLRSWRVVDGENNGNGHPYSYEILLRDSGHKDVGPSGEPFTHQDIFFTRQKSCEIYASHNPQFDGCASQLAGFINGESLNGQDLVVWPSLSFYHIPRAEDTPYMEAHWNFFQIIPRDWHTGNPYAGADTNIPPNISSPGNQSHEQGNPVSVSISASDVEGDTLTFSAVGLPTGLSIDPDSGQISGIPSAAGTFTPTVTVNDGQASQSVVFSWVITPSSQQWHNLGSFESASSENSVPGWSFWWNENGAVGQNAAYTQLQWNGSAWDGDGTDGPDSSQLSYGHLNSAGGHPGQGVDQGAAQGRYVISRYTSTVDADYRITSSQAAHVGCEWSDGLDLRVYANDQLKLQRTLSTTGAASNFDIELGTLAANSRIDVAIGPSSYDGCDSFSLVYSLQSSEEAGPVNRAPSISAISNQSGSVGTSISLSPQASDPDGDSLSYSASDLPNGLSINPANGLISGTPTTEGTFASTISVSDGDLSDSTSFNWTISAAGTQWIQLGTYQSNVTENPASGWAFLWNAQSTVGNSIGYTPLQWYGYGYDSDGVEGMDSTELKYGYLDSTGGHSGLSISQGAAQSRYVISRYTASVNAKYRIVASQIQHSGCQWSDGLDARVYVNDALKLRKTVSALGAAEDLDIDLGTLSAGSNIDIAVGPSNDDGCDAYSLDYALESTASPVPLNRAPQVTQPGDQNSTLGSAVVLSIQATDADGDSLSYAASGLPAGLSIDPASGTITGTPTTDDDYSTVVTVSDGQASNSVQFNWTVNPASGNWQALGTFSESVTTPPASGWSFLWNQNGSLGNSANYTALQWYGFGYDADGVAGVDNNELSYGSLDSSGAHPGQSSQQGAAADRYIISRYTTSSAGEYRISQSQASHNGCQWSDGIEVAVLVNDAQRLSKLIPAGGAASSIDLQLGQLASGSKIDVAIGPSGDDGCDSLALDYVLERQ